MKQTPIKKEIVDQLVSQLGIQDFAKATIREVKQVAAKAELESGVEYIKMEMGIPGLPAAEVGVKAQINVVGGVQCITLEKLAQKIFCLWIWMRFLK